MDVRQKSYYTGLRFKKAALTSTATKDAENKDAKESEDEAWWK